MEHRFFPDGLIRTGGVLLSLKRSSSAKPGVTALNVTLRVMFTKLRPNNNKKKLLVLDSVHRLLDTEHKHCDIFLHFYLRF